MTEKKADLIAQLLAKAESTTPEEAEALREHAYRLMEKYMIDQAVIDARRARDGQASEKIVTRIIDFDGAYRDSLMEMGAAVVWGLGQMRPLQSKGRVASDNPMHPRGKPVTHLHVIGFESDVAQAEVLIRSLHVQALLAMKAWWQVARDTTHLYRTPSEQARARAIFIQSFGHGVRARIEENRQHVIEEAGTGTELVLVDRKSKVDEYVDGMDIRKGRASRRQWDSSASAAGNVAGRHANTGERSMTMGRGLPAGR